MSYRCPCPNNNESVILYQINHKKKVAKLLLDFAINLQNLPK